MLISGESKQGGVLNLSLGQILSTSSKLILIDLSILALVRMTVPRCMGCKEKKKTPFEVHTMHGNTFTRTTANTDDFRSPAIFLLVLTNLTRLYGSMTKIDISGKIRS